MQTVWEGRTAYNHEELAGVTDKGGETLATLQAGSMSRGQALYYLNHRVDSQAVTIATNRVRATTAFCFAVAAFVIWLASKPTRTVSMAEVGH